MDFNITIPMTKQICIECGCVFFVADEVLRIRQEDKKSFYCYNGHAQSFSKSTAEKLREDLAALEQTRLRDLRNKNSEIDHLNKVIKDLKPKPDPKPIIKRKARRINS